MTRPVRSSAAALAFAAALSACGGTTAPEDVVTSVELSDALVALTSLGETQQVNATVRDQNGAAMAGAAVTWSSSNELVATVANGLVTAVATGAATITASSSGREAFLTVTVQPPGAGATGPSFSTVVQEILERRGCTAGVCHGGGAGYLALTSAVDGNYQNLVNVPSYGQPSSLLVQPGNATDSYIIMKLEGRGIGARMPLERTPLDAADLNAIKDWINGGAANN